MTEGLPVQQNKVIGDLFISLVSASPPVSTEEIVAALNAIFDVYSDERCSYNEVFTAGGYLAALTAVVSKCKSMVCRFRRLYLCIWHASLTSSYSRRLFADPQRG
jgi:hypothetical protein